MDVPLAPGVLRLSRSVQNATVTVSVAGEVEIATTPELRAYVQDALRAHAGAAQLVLELSGVSFMDAAGLGALVALTARAAQHDTVFLLEGMSPAITRLLEITGLAEVFPSILRADSTPVRP